MDQAILAMLGIIITLMLYLDRGRRADVAQLRQETRADIAQFRKEANNGFKRIYKRLDKLTDVVMDLRRRVGCLEGRSETPETTTSPAQ